MANQKTKTKIFNIKKKIIIINILILTIVLLTTNNIFAKSNENLSILEIKDKKSIEKYNNSFVNAGINLLQLLGNSLEGENTNEKVTIEFNDNVLYSKIKSKIEFVQDDNVNLKLTIKQDVLDNVKTLDLSGSGNTNDKISDITGLEKFTKLEELNLNSNNIKNLSKITNLSHLKKLELKSNGLENLPNLSSLILLNELDISGNKISNLEGIKMNQNITKLLASNNNINDIDNILGLKNLTELNLAKNNISDISNIGAFSELEVLNLSDNNSIHEIKAIQNLSKLTKLSLNNNNSITDLTKLVEKNSLTKTYYLINLEELELQNVNGKIQISSLKVLKNLKKLDLSNNGLTSASGIVDLQSLKTLYLNDNKIKDISAFVSYKTVNGVKVVDKRIFVEDLRMRNNEIEDISVLDYLIEISYLDLSKNHIHNIQAIENLPFLASNKLYLQNQTGNFNVKKKNNEDIKQKIILADIFQKCTEKNNKLYSETSQGYQVTGTAVNNTDTYELPDGVNGRYDTHSGYYNIVFPAGVEAGEQAIVTINGGNAGGSTFTYTISTGTGSKIYDSIEFKDFYLLQKVQAELINQEKYAWSVPYILNLEFKDIADVTQLKLDGSDGLKVRNVSGIENFINLQQLYLNSNSISSDNSISDIDKLKFLSKITHINLSNNELTSLDVITNYLLATEINLANNSINDLNPFIQWQANIGKNTLKLTHLNVSGNEISDLLPIKDITTLTDLHVGHNKISNIKVLENMKDLTTLNISNNKITDINVLKNLTNLKSLYLEANKVTDISSISSLGLYNLNISNNRIESLDSLRTMSSLTNLESNINKISTIEPIKNFVIDDFGLNFQKLTYALKETDIGTVKIELPKLFNETKEINSKVYTENEFTLNNCILDQDGKHIIINKDELKGKIASIIINGGNANGSAFSIAEPIEATITYSREELTNKNVTATITFDRTEVSIINNDGSNEYTFTKNGEFIFEYEDEYGFSGTTKAIVNWIDKEGPRAEITLDTETITNKNITVTITTDEACSAVEGWNLSVDKKVLTKKYAENKTEEIILKDLLGNESTIEIKVTNIDKIAPVVEGVENGETYKTKRKIKVTDLNLKVSNMLHDGQAVAPDIGTTETTYTINKNGKYTLTAEDKAGNTTIVNFTIEIEKEPIVTNLEFKFKNQSGYVETKENNINFVKNIMPKTTIQNFINNIETNGSIKILKGQTEVTNNNINISTGMKLMVFNNNQKEKEYEIVVIGDCTGDGEADFNDIIAINKHRLGKKTLSEIFELAGDVDGDKEVGFKDIIKINKYRLNKITEI